MLNWWQKRRRLMLSWLSVWNHSLTLMVSHSIVQVAPKTRSIRRKLMISILIRLTCRLQWVISDLLCRAFWRSMLMRSSFSRGRLSTSDTLCLTTTARRWEFTRQTTHRVTISCLTLATFRLLFSTKKRPVSQCLSWKGGALSFILSQASGSMSCTHQVKTSVSYGYTASSGSPRWTFSKSK